VIRVVKHLQTNGFMITQAACGAKHSLVLATSNFSFSVFCYALFLSLF